MIVFQKNQGCKNFPGNYESLQNSWRRRGDLHTYLLHGAESFFEKPTDFQLVKKFHAFYGS
jgi:hypothetical protein